MPQPNAQTNEGFPKPDQIPIATAKAIAKAHGYDQVIVYGRRIGTPGQEWVTTYGVNPAHSEAAARIGACIGNGVVRPHEQLRQERDAAIAQRDEWMACYDRAAGLHGAAERRYAPALAALRSIANMPESDDGFNPRTMRRMARHALVGGFSVISPADAEQGLEFVIGLADRWGEAIRLVDTIKNVAHVARLSRSAPDHVREKFVARQESLIDALVKQAFLEGWLAGDENGRNVEAVKNAPALQVAARDGENTAKQVEAQECHGLDTPERVCFYEQDFYVLSNFSAFRLRWAGRDFDTSEAAYHWEKFRDRADIQFEIEMAESAHDAFKIAERNKHHRRPDWDDVKVDIMRDILRTKADQHEYVRRKLLATGDRELVENSWRDDFWGWGPNRDGENMLGRLWMVIREELRGSASPKGGK